MLTDASLKMTTADAAVAAMRGQFDIFDRLWEQADELIEKLRAADPEEMAAAYIRDDSIVDKFFGLEPQTELQIVDVREQYIAQLEAFKIQIYEDCALFQEVIAALPN